MIPIPEPEPKPDPIIFSNTRTRSDPKLKNPTRQPLITSAAVNYICPLSPSDSPTLNTLHSLVTKDIELGQLDA